MIYGGSGKLNSRKAIPLLLYVLVFCSRVFAHAELQETYPANLDVLENPPEEFFVLYDEPVSPARIRLLDQSGEEVPLGEIRTTNSEVRFSPVSPLSDGQYILSIRVISLDAHPIASSVGFSIGNLPPPIPTISEADIVTRTLLRIIQLIHLPAILVCIGFILYPFIFTIVEPQEPVRLRTLAALSLIGLITTVLNLGLWGVLINGEGFLTILESSTWSQASDTTLGTRSGLLAGGLTGILLSLSLGHDYPTGKYLGLFGAILLALSFAASGHAASSGILFKPVFIIHALAAGIWFGAIFILFTLTRSEDSQKLKQIMFSFSERAKYLVGVLLICALILVLHQLDGISAMLNSQYGILLLIKIFLVISVLLIAIVNRWHYLPSLDDSAPTIKTRLRRSIGVETFVLFLIVAVTTVLASTSPDETDNDQDSWVVTLTGGNNLITKVTVNPMQIGQNTAELQFFIGEELFDPLEVQVQWLQQDAGIEPVTQIATRTDAGMYRVNDLNFLIPGEWTMRINVLIDDFTRERLETNMIVE